MKIEVTCFIDFSKCGLIMFLPNVNNMSHDGSRRNRCAAAGVTDVVVAL
jgi:hypothetical protein